jgi:lipopolysaccharide export system protein LptA
MIDKRILCLMTLVSVLAVGAEPGTEVERLSAIGDKMARDDASQTITLVGHARVSQEDEIKLAADRITIDKSKAVVTCEGHCEFETAGPKWQASTMSFKVVEGVWELLDHKDRHRVD